MDNLTPFRLEIEQLAKLRKECDDDKSDLQILKDALEETKIYEKWISASEGLKIKRLKVSGLVDEIKKSGVELYNEGEREFPGCKAKEFKIMDYETIEAVIWAIDHNHPELLFLNVNAFEKAAKVLEIFFVDPGSEIRMSIAQDLSEFLFE
jgi:hypothetical protein